jgi:serine phosphatase RsbU (regulator of sigma subunit)
MSDSERAARVLVVDADEARAQALASLVRSGGFRVDVHQDASIPVERLGEASDYDVVLSELRAEWGGAGGRRSLRERAIDVPVIMLSDQASSDNMMSALRLGASDFFARPVDDREALFASMERCIRQRGISRELQRSRERLERANRELNQTVRVLERDQQAGRQVQMRMLPGSPLVLGDYVFSHTVIPSLYLSGDFTDYFTVGTDFVVFFMADVSGHGSSSAFATVLLKNLFARKRSDFLRRADATVLEPLRMLGLANKELLDLGVSKYATMIVGVLDMSANTLTYSVAGHLPLPVLVSPEGATYLEGKGNAVGMLPEASYTQQVLSLPPSFMLALFSDGILEILPAQNLLEKERLFLEVFREGVESPAVLAARLGLDSVETAPDDIAALFLSKRG